MTSGGVVRVEEQILGENSSRDPVMLTRKVGGRNEYQSAPLSW